MDLSVPAPSDGVDYKTAEYMGHWGLERISADKAYQRGYFGQGATIAVADDGMDLTHPDLAGKITAPRHLQNGNSDVTELSEDSVHGTYVALIAAGKRANTGGTFQIEVDHGNAIPTKNVHGVAPQASVMPIQMSGGAAPPEAVRWAVDNRAHVVNFSIGLPTFYYGTYDGEPGLWLSEALPRFQPLLSQYPELTDHLTVRFAEVAGIVASRDIAMVWAAGNSGWNAVSRNAVNMCGKNFRGEDGCELGQRRVATAEFMEKFEWLYDPNDPSRTVSFRDMWGTDCGSASCVDYNSAGEWMVAPLFEPRLLGKWLVVGAIDENGRIASYSNGCGGARNWCLMAPGSDLAILPTGPGISGTSFAAPMVSGALAVLKSRFPSMPMEVVQALLLVSADPLGTRLNDPEEPDPVYGWGRLNLENAITRQGTVRLPYSVEKTTGAVTLRNARVVLAPALAHVGDRAQAVEVAAGSVGGAYYNMKLSDIVAIETEDPLALGYAAGDMLGPASGYRVENQGVFAELGRETGDVYAVGMDFSTDAFGRWRLGHNLCGSCETSVWREWGAFQAADTVSSPFFARAGGAVELQMQGNGVRPFAAFSGPESRRAPWRQLGLQWRHAQGGFDLVAEFSRIDESRSVWGTDFGALGRTRTETRRKRLFLSGPLKQNWRGFLSFERYSGDVSVNGGMLSGISGLRAEGWSAGTQGRNIFRDDDTLRISARQETGVRNGKLRIDHFVATGSSFVDAFYHGHSQSLEQSQTAIDLRVRPTMRYSLGYAVPVQDTQLAFGLEHEGESGSYAISTQLRVKF